MTVLAEAPKTRMQRLLDAVERIGNRVPHPVMIFVYLIAVVIVLSAALAALGAHVTYQAYNPTPATSRRCAPPPAAAHGRGHPLHVHRHRPELHELQRGRRDHRGDGRRRRGRGKPAWSRRSSASW